MGKPFVFALNGERVEVADPDPSMTLITYIRTFTRFKGTKLGCAEGGCGACVVLLARYDPATGRVEEASINSCLALLCSLHLCAVTTTEGLGNSSDGLHAIHQRIAGFHATQCGFCTPGVAMALYARLRQPDGDSLSAASAERAIQGNICRCTGYRPILDACKSFAQDADLEDLGLNTFWDRKECASRDLLPGYTRSGDPVFPHFLLQALEAEQVEQQRIRYLDGGVAERVWVRARSLPELFAELREHEGSGKEVRLVVGNTSSGIFKDARPDVFVDISAVPELVVVMVSDAGVEVGAAVSLTRFISALEESRGSVVHGQVAEHLERLASAHVRNRGSVGGNLILSQQEAFDSDLATVLLGAGASVKIAGSGGLEAVLGLEEFLEKGGLDFGTVLQSVNVPSWSGTEQVVFKTYRASPRPLGNAVSYANAAFLAHIAEGEGGRHVVEWARLAFGAFGSKHAVLAVEVQEVLAGKEVTPHLLLEAIAVLKATVVPAQGTHKAAYRASLVVGFFFDFFRPFLPVREGEADNVLLNGTHHSTGGLGNGHVLFSNGDGAHKSNGGPENGLLTSAGASENGHRKAGKGTKAKTLSTGTQKIAVSDDFFPVGKAVPKLAADLQAAGEAVYVDDVPAPEGCLYAAFVISDRAVGEIKKIDASRALASPGAVSFLTADDIPKGGQNVSVNMFGAPEPLFATDKVEFHGHPLGLLVADSYQHARDAASKVIVTYDPDKTETPILSIDDAVAKNSYISVPPMVAVATAPLGDTEKAFSQSELKIENAEVFCETQYHFYMEMQTALAVPDEDGQMVVYSACQSTQGMQFLVAKFLGIPYHNVRIITRRLGGSFGGKASKAGFVTAASAFAAWKLKRPVRMYLDRKTDMLIVGGRNPMKVNYSVAFSKHGKISALQMKVVMDSGCQPDLTVYLPLLLHSATKKYDWGAFKAEYEIVRTNKSSKTSVRAPGDIQGAFIAETVVHHVAAELGISVHEVREKNMHSLETVLAALPSVGGVEGFTLPVIWEALKLSSSFVQRTQEVESFNVRSKWHKRGLAMIPAVYDIVVRESNARVTAFPDGSVVVEVGGIEMGQGLWTKVKQTAAHGLSLVWDQKPGGVDITQVRVVQADSISLGNSGITGASSTSENNCLSVLQACGILVERLKPLKQKLEEGSPDGVSWETLVFKASMTGIDLGVQTTGRVNPPTEKHYVTFGAAVTEVEIDILTGETVILRTDLLYDCGRSLSPAVDLGQVEGAFVQGIGWHLTEEIQMDDEGRQVTEGTWLYKPPTLDNIPRIFNIELLTSAPNKERILSSKASGEPPALLAASVHSAVREAIAVARLGVYGKKGAGFFRLDSTASVDKVKTLCGLDNVETYLSSLITTKDAVAR